MLSQAIRTFPNAGPAHRWVSSSSSDQLAGQDQSTGDRDADPKTDDDDDDHRRSRRPKDPRSAEHPTSHDRYKTQP